MEREKIKDWTGKIIGFIDTYPDGNKLLRNFYGKIIGRYDKRMNVTRDFYGRLIARGDHLTLLLDKPNK